MPLLHWMFRRLGLTHHDPRQRKPARRAPLPHLEKLEDRLTPSTGEIHGTVFNDVNGDGVRAPGGEPGLANRMVYLDQNQNGQLDSGELATTTAADGSYAFLNLPLGTYYVAELLPTGWVQSTPTSAERTVTLTQSQPYTFNFNNLASTTTYTLPAYHENGYTFDTNVSNSTKLRVFGSSDTGFYAGSAALSSQWAPAVISLTQDNGQPFNLTSIDLAPFSSGAYTPYVTFTGTRADNTTVQQSFSVPSGLTFHTFTFSNFTNVVKVTWNFTNTTDYHQFDNVVVGTPGTLIASGVDFGTLQAAAPSVTINDVSLAEGNTGINNFYFTVKLATSFQYPVTVYYSTADGTATAGSDYDASSGSVVFQAGYTYKNIAVPVHGDLQAEPDETFFVNLNAAVNGVITRPQGTGTILNDDGLAAADDSFSVNEDSTLTVPAPGVLANDTAVNGNPFSASLVTYPSHGSLTFNADGSFTYTPATHYYGSDSFTYRDTQGSAVSNTARVNLTVNFVNHAPVAVNDSYTVNEDGTLTASSAVGGTSLTMTSQPGDYIGQGQTYNYTTATGTFGVSGSNKVLLFSYQDINPAAWWYVDFAAPQGATLSPGYFPNATRYPFEAANVPGLSVSGEGRGSNGLTGNFTVLQAIYGPSGQVQNFDATFEQHSEGATPALFGEIKYNATPTPPGVLVNDTDVENQPLTAFLVSGPGHGSLILNANGTFTYTPAPNFNGIDSFTYKANDGSLDSNVATVTITVNPVNDAPSFVKGADQVVTENAGPQTVAGWATAISAGPPDESGQNLNFVVTTNNAALFAAAPAIDPATGTLSYTPAPGAVGSATVTVQLHDDGGTANGGVDTSAAQTFTITVNDAPLTPQFAGPSSVNEGSLYTLSLSAADPDQDTITGWTITWGDGTVDTVAGNPSAVTHTYADGPNSYTISATATDEDGTYNAGNTIAVTVNNVAPTLTLSGAASVDEGSSYTLGLSSSDPGQDTISQWVIAWSDGAVQTVPGNPSAVTHSYADGPNTFTISATATDEDGTYNAGNTVAVIVNNVAPTLVLSGAASVNEGSNYTLNLSSSDPGQDTISQWVITWGDGTVDTVAGNPSSVPHTYADGPNSFTISATATDEDGTYNAGNTVAVIVNNVAPTLTLSGAASVNEGSSYTLNLSSSDPGKDTLSQWVISWGDGAVQTVPGNPSSVSHTYADGPNSFTISATATDEDGTYNAGNTIAVTVNNVAPTLTLSGAASVNEGSSYTLGLSSSDPGQDTISQWVINWGDGAVQTVPGNPSSVSHVYADGPNNFTISGIATDEDGTYFADNTVSVHVNNVAPTADGLSGPASGARGQPRTFMFTATDPSPVDQAGNFTFAIAWGDGSTQTVVGPSGIMVDHTYINSGSYNVQLTSATDKDGGQLTQTVSQALTIKAVDMQGNNLVVGGTSGADQIVFTPVDRSGTFKVTINGVSQGNFNIAGEIIAYGQAGNDTIQLASAKIHGQTTYITNSAVLFGGDGNDTLDAQGSTANTILVGGAGDDTLIGSLGRDILIGGLGRDKVSGNSADDIVIGDVTDYDGNLAALNALMAEWGRTDLSYQARINHLTGSVPGGANGGYFLNTTTVHDDAASDQLYGKGGLDWFFYTAAGSNRDRLNDLANGEVATPL